jgi:pimeloyl-ACP methyl ester carboxylesterase
MMPAVAARLHDRVDGMVLVGGGANLLQISQESDLTDGGLKIDWNDDLLRGPLRNELYEHYLAASRLDPYALAPAIQDIPTLLVLAGMDSIVPAETGRVLWRRLGKPERYTTPFGHALLFWQLSSHAGKISDWIDRAADRPSLPKADSTQ